MRCCRLDIPISMRSPFGAKLISARQHIARCRAPGAGARQAERAARLPYKDMSSSRSAPVGLSGAGRSRIDRRAKWRGANSHPVPWSQPIYSASGLFRGTATGATVAREDLLGSGLHLARSLVRHRFMANRLVVIYYGIRAASIKLIIHCLHTVITNVAV